MRYRIPSTHAPAPRSAILLSEILIRRFASRVTASAQPQPSAASHKCYVMDVPSQGFGMCRFVFCGNVACRTCIGPLLVLCLVVTSQIQRASRGNTGRCPFGAYFAMASHGRHASLRHEETCSPVRNFALVKRDTRAPRKQARLLTV
jgi:hypothetical protein